MSWTLACLNMNGVRSAVRKGFRNWRPRSKADVFALQELRMQAHQMGPEHRAPRGWKSVQADAQKKGYSGSAVWSRLPVLGQSTGMGLDWADNEGRVARLDLAPASVISVYLPSGSSGPVRQAQKEVFMDHLFARSQEWLAEGRPMVVCGDLNIAHTKRDIHNPTGNKKNSGFLPHEREWFTRLLDLGWVDLWRHMNPEAQEYSWWSQRGQARALDRGWRLDYLLVTPDLAERAEACWIVGRKPALSDHCPVMARFG